MAFEDRCSPNQATTPGPDPRQSSPKSPDPSDRNPKPYTCSTMTTKYERSKSPQLRTNPNTNMTQYKQELIQVNPMINPFHASPIMYNPYYNPYIINTLPIHPDYIIQLQLQQQNLNAPKLLIDNHQRQNNNIIHDAVANRRNHNEVMIVNTEENDLHFSISNILKPEFGSSAIRKTTHKIEGPKHGGPTHSILYKPYEIAKGLEDSEHVERNTEDSPFKTAPLGSLCNTVSQIGTKNFATKALKAQENLVKSNSGFSSSFGASKDDLSSIRRPDSANSSISTSSSNVSSQQGLAGGSDDAKSGDAANPQWPAWVYCTRYSDRPSSGPRSRRAKKPKQPAPAAVVAPVASVSEDKRPRTAFSSSQLQRLKHEFAENRYLNERRRQQLSGELGLNEAQIKIWFQNKRAKIKKASGQKNPLALQLMAQGLYNHGTASCSEGEEDEMTDIQVA